MTAVLVAVIVLCVVAFVALGVASWRYRGARDTEPVWTAAPPEPDPWRPEGRLGSDESGFMW